MTTAQLFDDPPELPADDPVARAKLLTQFLETTGFTIKKVAKLYGVSATTILRWRSVAVQQRDRESSKRWQKANPEKARERRKRWQKANPEKARESIRRWQKANPDKVRETDKRWKKLNPEKHLESVKRWKKANPDKVCEFVKRTQQRPRWRVMHSQRTRFRQFLTQKRTTGQLADWIGCDWDALIAWIEVHFEFGMTWENHGLWHIDHIRPLASFDLTDPEQAAIAWHWSNLQPMWAEANRKKSAKYDPPAAELHPCSGHESVAG